MQQVGINTRTFGDVLLFDQVVTGKVAEHAAAAAKVAALEPSAIRIGFPSEIFVDNGTETWHEGSGIASGTAVGMRASDNILAKLEACADVLGKAGFDISRDEWPKVDSPRFGKPINALRHLIFGIEYAPGKYCTGNNIVQGSHSFAGQAATFCADFLDGCDVSVNQIRNDITPVGDHNPAGLLGTFTDESQFRFMGQWQRLGVGAWNSCRIVMLSRFACCPSR